MYSSLLIITQKIIHQVISNANGFPPMLFIETLFTEKPQILENVGVAHVEIGTVQKKEREGDRGIWSITSWKKCAESREQMFILCE